MKISVIMPSLNVASYIEECIESVSKQDMRDIEIICIDAGSTDGTRELIQKYADNDERIRIIDSDIRSYGHQINIGIREAKGEYISIVETDDYIASNMLSYLYKQAKKYNADVSKAEYYRFFINYTGEKIFDYHHLFRNDDKRYYYQKIIKDRVPNSVFYDDTNIWSAIYRRSFLIETGIRLNESSGAAFQDIGFMQQIHMFAECMVFSDMPLYYYRMDRPNSSTNASMWLRNIYQEFEFILNSSMVNTKEWKKTNKLFVNRILYIYIDALEKAIITTNFEIDDVPWRYYYNKFRPILKSYIDDYEMSKDKFSNASKNILFLSNYSLESYRDYVKVKCYAIRQKKMYLLQQCRDKKIIIFGSGMRGKKCYEFLKENGMRVSAFWDNDRNKLGSEYQGVSIVMPESILSDDNNVFIIAVRGAEELITRQIKELGGKEESIYYFDW